MSVANRPEILQRTLTAWSLLDYPDFDFTIIDNGTNNSRIPKIIESFKDKLHATYVLEPKVTAVNILYNRYGKASRGEYIVFSMMDELISHGDILQKMVNLSEDRRASLATSFMSNELTASLDKDLAWQTNPSLLPTTWGSQVIPQAGILGHIAGNYRKNWEWFGWYQDLPIGHLWLEQDIYIREICLDRVAHTPMDVWCYHQAHPAAINNNDVRPGFRYLTEAQARLLEPAPSEREGR